MLLRDPSSCEPQSLLKLSREITAGAATLLRTVSFGKDTTLIAVLGSKSRCVETQLAVSRLTLSREGSGAM